MWIVAGVVLTIFWIFTVFPLFLSILAKLVPERKKIVNPVSQIDFACVITAYKDVECAFNLVNTLLKQNYEQYHVYLVADDCIVAGLTLSHPRLTVLRPDVPLHSKVKSIHYALDRLVRNHSHFIVFDPDNLAHPNFLEKINLMHARGYEVVQGKRIAKNLDTKYACLDAFSEYYYNYTQRTTPFKLGSSATIAGSAMSLPIPLYLQFIKDEFSDQGNKIVIAEDKMLQIYVVEKGYRIAFADTAVVFDEKVSTAHQVKRQRTRWITSYFQFLMAGLGLFIRSLFTFNLNKLLFAYIIIVPPMFIVGLVWIILSILTPFLSWSHFITVQSCFLAMIVNIFVSLIFANAPQPVISSLFYAPYFVLNQIKALFSMKQTKTSFLTTEKTKNVSLEEVLNAKR